RDADSMERLKKMRLLYEGYALVLSNYLCMPLPPWIPDQPHKDNWLSVAKVRQQTESVSEENINLETALPLALQEDDEHHMF
ncbi:MAG TPA: two pore domain potassium channel family protein, partial [Silvibacterium sp.]|nr:two pore domain potassium channel family protein [Silvibacterium sp.]